ncbi:hypothetical protein HUG20_11085 [Salicibibacter cibi]|uniref:Uncharacterized protein n=1 Tax=Salicibibacter cibi TaxID=2743001 RepID=A0A7T6ZC93_9BACI|nr:hypothetical protein [Salicibibacter cibi]QQK80381.1 hypothetical protein HUG20_11085 [Salicibibacter cibi]
MKNKQELYKAITEKTEQMDDPEFVSGPSLNKKDAIAIAVIALISVISLVWGILI